MSDVLSPDEQIAELESRAQEVAAGLRELAEVGNVDHRHLLLALAERLEEPGG